MDKINVEAILDKNGVGWVFNSDQSKKLLSGTKKSLKAAIKEIVEAVIDKCAEKSSDYKTNDWSSNKESILNIKKEISYD